MRSILCIQSCTFDPLMYLSPCGAGVVDTGPRPCSPVPETSWSERGALPLVSACSVVWRRARRTATEQVHMQTQTAIMFSTHLQEAAAETSAKKTVERPQHQTPIILHHFHKRCTFKGLCSYAVQVLPAENLKSSELFR